MSIPCYIHIQTNGDIWFGNDASANPKTGTNAAIFRVNSDAMFQKVGTISGSAGAYAVSSGTGKNGKEIT